MRKFRVALSSSGLNVTLPSEWNLNPREEGRAPEVRGLGAFVLKCRMHGILVAELSRFVVDLLHRRERMYRFCIARATSDLVRFPLPVSESRF